MMSQESIPAELLIKLCFSFVIAVLLAGVIYTVMAGITKKERSFWLTLGGVFMGAFAGAVAEVYLDLGMGVPLLLACCTLAGIIAFQIGPERKKPVSRKGNIRASASIRDRDPSSSAH
jgi:hypothetical protein